MLQVLFSKSSPLRIPTVAFATVVAPLCGFVAAQQEAPPSVFRDYEYDSGWFENTSTAPEVVLAFPVYMEGAEWIRLYFEELDLSGDVLGGTGSILRMTALEDGAIQEMNARHTRQWQNSSAYFNGDTVLVEVLAQPGSGWNRVAMRGIDMGLPPFVDPSICGNNDDRVLSTDPRAARLLPIGCTGWLINDCKQCFLTAGHCAGGTSVIEFNVPLSDSGGGVNHPGPQDQYSVDASSMQTNGGLGLGDDWAYFGAFANSNTGLTPGQAQGSAFDLANPPSVSGNDIRITGYGTDSSPSTSNQVQQTHVGPLVTSSGSLVQYATDTTGGNSGSPVIWEQTGQAVGIHTHGGCSSGGGQNTGTGVSHSGLQAALANPQGICTAGITLTSAPNGIVPPGAPIDIQVELQGAGTSVTLHYRLNGGAFQAQAMTSLGGDQYLGTIPAPTCNDNPDFYISYQEATCGLVTNPVDAPSNYYSLAVGTEEAVLEDDFETDLGWTTSSSGATTGFWERGVPVDDPGWAYDPASDSDGSGSCYLTQNQTGNTDVDGGSVSLISPVIDLSSAGSFVSYDYYLYLTNTDGTDRLLVEARNGTGAWQTVQIHDENEGLNWSSDSLSPGDFTSAGIALSNDVQMRFTANDTGAASICEAGLDHFFVGGVTCGDSLGTNYCVSGANGAVISATGSASVSANDLVLVGDGVPANVNGIFFYGDLEGFTPLGNGFRCVFGSSGIFRLPPVGNSGPGGQIVHAVDLTNPPIPAGQVTAGSIWNYQLWFRDGGSSDLTDALSIQFTP